MGGSDSTVQRHYHTVQYRTDPQVLQMVKGCQAQMIQLTKLIQTLQKNYELALLEAKKLQDPAKYQQFKEKAFVAFVDNLTKIKFTDPMNRIDGHKYNVLIGNISSGKSSLINFACGLDLDVGLGQVTQVASQVAKSADGKVHIWDCPGINQQFSIFQPQTLSYFHTADRIFILYPESIKNCKQIVTVMAKIKPNGTFMVRTKCDAWDPKHKKTIEQEVQTDKKYLQQKLKVKLPVLATSSKMTANFKDNQMFVSLLTT